MGVRLPVLPIDIAAAAQDGFGLCLLRHVFRAVVDVEAAKWCEVSSRFAASCLARPSSKSYVLLRLLCLVCGSMLSSCCWRLAGVAPPSFGDTDDIDEGHVNVLFMTVAVDNLCHSTRAD